MGTVFKMTPQGEIITIFSFTGQGGPVPGRTPLAGLIQGSDGNLYGTCAYGGTYGGGNIFRIIMSGPLLSVSVAAGQMVLSWRTNYVGFTLQSSPSLSAPAWTDCANNPPVVIGHDYVVTNAIAGAATFYRLRK